MGVPRLPMKGAASRSLSITIKSYRRLRQKALCPRSKKHSNATKSSKRERKRRKSGRKVRQNDRKWSNRHHSNATNPANSSHVNPLYLLESSPFRTLSTKVCSCSGCWSRGGHSLPLSTPIAFVRLNGLKMSGTRKRDLSLIW